MAVRGFRNLIFTTTLTIDAWMHLGADIAPYLVRWTEIPIIEPSFPQDSLEAFLIAHLFLAKATMH
jgi:hypothetical protein